MIGNQAVGLLPGGTWRSGQRLASPTPAARAFAAVLTRAQRLEIAREALALRPVLHDDPAIPRPPAVVREAQEGEGSWPPLATASRWHWHALSGGGMRVRDLGVRGVGAA